MANTPTNIRLDSILKKRVLRRAKQEGLSLAEIAKFFFRAYADGKFSVEMIEKTPEYSEKLIDWILKETQKMEQFHTKGKSKGYTSGKAFIDGILSE